MYRKEKYNLTSLLVILMFGGHIGVPVYDVVEVHPVGPVGDNALRLPPQICGIQPLSLVYRLLGCHCNIIDCLKPNLVYQRLSEENEKTL